MCLGLLRAKQQALLASRSVSAPNPKVPSVGSPAPLGLTILTSSLSDKLTSSLAKRKHPWGTLSLSMLT